MHPRSRKVQTVPCFGSVEFATCVWIACAVLTLLASAEGFRILDRYGKRHEPRVDPLMWLRYGRSDGSQNGMPLPNAVDAMPRKNRLFLNIRYGKRSSPDYRTVSSVDRFNAVLGFVGRDESVREIDASNASDPEFLS
nr:uncharacterized protein LOC117226234 [Megalopta genalis]